LRFCACRCERAMMRVPLSPRRSRARKSARILEDSLARDPSFDSAQTSSRTTVDTTPAVSLFDSAENTRDELRHHPSRYFEEGPSTVGNSKRRCATLSEPSSTRARGSTLFPIVLVCTAREPQVQRRATHPRPFRDRHVLSACDRSTSVRRQALLDHVRKKRSRRRVPRAMSVSRRRV
jgi:hypothetical protein